VSEPSDDSGWREIEYESSWARFNQRFDFKPDFHERTRPALRLDPDCLVLDLGDLFADAGPRIAAGTWAINAAALRAFVWLAGDGDLIALNWQHPSWRYSAALNAVRYPDPLNLPVPVFPNGDYYAHMKPDLHWGTFGHPWQHSLCIWGDDLVDTLGAELLTWLPRHPQSQR
jgi:hypothetical protein